MKFLLIPILFMTLVLNAGAIGVDKDRLQDPEQEARAQHLMKQLRCLVCQNQSIVESDAELAQDLRAIVREQISAGKTDAEIFKFMTVRYGDWVLLKPPFNSATAILWLGPIALLLIGGFLIFRTIRQKPEQDVTRPLTAAEENHLKKIMKDNNG
ncbi:MAG: cytochrome C biogenesis protein CcmH [Alphaproteobacteria bacterium]|nr:MAG: cytochrome C biogenesis protein CcmH [Alphaproteobacteria bacterium]